MAKRKILKFRPSPHHPTMYIAELECGHEVAVRAVCNPKGSKAVECEACAQVQWPHVMLDLETLSSRPDAFIVSIGAVAFSFDSPELGPEFYRVVDTKQDYGLRVDADTAAWWAKQSSEARAVFQEKGDILSNVLGAFTVYLLGLGKDMPCVWGNGATFDNMILRNAYRANGGGGAPWPYKNDLCYRTMRRVFNIPYVEPTVKHNALEDAKAQARALVAGLGPVLGKYGAREWFEEGKAAGYVDGYKAAQSGMPPKLPYYSEGLAQTAPLRACGFARSGGNGAPICSVHGNYLLVTDNQWRCPVSSHVVGE